MKGVMRGACGGTQLIGGDYARRTRDLKKQEAFTSQQTQHPKEAYRDIEIITEKRNIDPFGGQTHGEQRDSLESLLEFVRLRDWFGHQLFVFNIYIKRFIKEGRPIMISGSGVTGTMFFGGAVIDRVTNGTGNDVC